MIYKYSSGGMSYLPSTGAAAAKQTAAASTEESKVPGFAKELIAIVKENGLDNDVDRFLGQVQRILDTRDGGNTLTTSDLVAAQRLANKVKTNYTYYQKVTESLDKENA